MHSLQVLHRDLKAANCFLTARNLVKVGDFGIAKTLETNEELARTTVGTPYYMSPEVINGEPYAYGADMWALGVLIYELLTLRRPFQATTLPKLALLILGVDYPRLCTSESGFSEEVLGLLESLLCREPETRPTAQQVCGLPLISRHHARLHAELRSLALLNISSGMRDADEPRCREPVAEALLAHQSSAAPDKYGNLTARDLPEASGGGQGARAAACALCMQNLLGDSQATVVTATAPGGLSATALAVTPPRADARTEPSAITTPTGVEARMRFSQNLHALELNLASTLEQGGLPDRALPIRQRVSTPFSSPFSAVSCSPRLISDCTLLTPTVDASHKSPCNLGQAALDMLPRSPLPSLSSPCSRAG